MKQAQGTLRQSPSLRLVLVLFAVLAVGGQDVEARLSPPKELWTMRFDPPYDNRTLKLQMRVYDWWLGSQDTAVLPKGTPFPVLDEYCNWDPNVCPSWKLPADVTFQFGSPTVQDAHRLNIFMTDTGTRVPVYTAPTEQLTSTTGCSGSPSTNTVCCNNNNNSQEYTLRRYQVQHAAFKMWVSRPNGTVVNDGTQPPNFRSAGAQLTIKTGYYTSTIAWPNYFFQNVGSAASDPQVQASIALAADSTSNSYLDVVSNLVNNYTILVPLNDPGAPGFVVPTSQLSEQPAALDVGAWKACRTARCGDPLGACTAGIPASPYPQWINSTSASVIADGWNALGRGVKKQCTVLGNGPRTFINPDMTPGDMHTTQFVSCDYVGTYLVPVIKLPRSVVEAGNTAPPPPPAPSPPLSPSVSILSSPTSGVTSLPSSFVRPPSPSPPPTQGQAPSIYVQCVIPAYSPAPFNSSGQDAFIKAINKATATAFTKPTIRFRSITSPPASATTRRRSILGAASPSGTLIDIVVYFASSADTTTALAFLSQLNNKPSAVFPTSDFGSVTVNQAAALNCVTPCGTNGQAGPRITQGGVSCTCECNDGWSTVINQPFDTFKYCSVQISSTNGSLSGGGSGSTPSGGVMNAVMASWRPPVPIPPPPPPKEYKDSGGGGLSAGGIAGIVIACLLLCVVVYIAWKTGCACCKSSIRCIAARCGGNKHTGGSGDEFKAQAGVGEKQTNDQQPTCIDVEAQTSSNTTTATTGHKEGTQPTTTTTTTDNSNSNTQKTKKKLNNNKKKKKKSPLPS